MYRIVIIMLLSALIITTESKAQRVSARVNIGINTPPAPANRGYGYGNGYQGRIAMQRARLNEARRMAMYDGFITRRERAMIRAEKRELDYLMGGRGYRRGF